MFNGVKKFIKKVGVMLGIIEQIENIGQLKEVALPKEYYSRIETWKSLHKGYNKDIHCVPHFSIANGHGTRTLATLNATKVVSRDLASLIFNERCEVSISADDKFTDFVNGVLKDNSFNAKFQQQLEYMFAYGGLVVKPYLDNGVIKLSYATADTFIPVSWDNNDITEVVFTSSLVNKGKYYTLLEWHVFEDGVYKVKNELFESESQLVIGTKVSLSRVFPELQEEVVFNGLKKPLFVYFKPNEANNIDNTLPLGISIYANAIDTIKTIDTIYDSLQREFRLGRKRIIVPPSAIRTIVDPETQRVSRYFDATDETYEAPNIGNMDSEQIKEINSTLRVDEHVSALNAALNLLATQLGLSTGFISFDGATGLKTATEVISENSKTFRTKQSHENVIEDGIAKLVYAIGALGEASGMAKIPKDLEVTVSFDDSIIQDKDAITANQILLINSKLQDRKSAIMTIFGLTEQEALEKIQEIDNESMMAEPEFLQMQTKVDVFGDDE